MNEVVLIFGKLIHVVTEARDYINYANLTEADIPTKYERTHIVSDKMESRFNSDSTRTWYRDGAVIYLAPESLDMSDAIKNIKIVTEASVEAASIIFRQLGAGKQSDVRISAVTIGYIADSIMVSLIKNIKANKAKEEK